MTCLARTRLEGPSLRVAANSLRRHHLDTLLNTENTVGDEGEMFRRLLGGEKFDEDQLAAIRADNVRVLIDSADFGAHPDRDGSRRGVGRVSTSRWPGVHPVAMTDCEF